MSSEKLAVIRCPLCGEPLRETHGNYYECVNSDCRIISVQVRVSFYNQKVDAVQSKSVECPMCGSRDIGEESEGDVQYGDGRNSGWRVCNECGMRF